MNMKEPSSFETPKGPEQKKTFTKAEVWAKAKKMAAEAFPNSPESVPFIQTTYDILVKSMREQGKEVIEE